MYFLNRFPCHTKPHQVEPDHTAPLPRLAGAEPNLPIFSNSISSPCHSLPNRGLLVPATEHHTTPRLIFSNSSTNLCTSHKRANNIPTIFTWLWRMISNATTHEEKQWHEHSHDSEARTPHRHLTQHRHSRCNRAMPSRSATSRAVPNRAAPKDTLPNKAVPCPTLPCRTICHRAWTYPAVGVPFLTLSILLSIQ